MKKKSMIRNPEFDYNAGIIDVKQLSASMLISSYHYHDGYEICIVQRGFIDVLMDYMPRRIGADTVVMCGPDAAHGVVGCSEDIAGLLIHIRFSASPDSFISGVADIQFMQKSRYGYLFVSPELTAKSAALGRKLGRTAGFMKLSHLFRLLDMLSGFPGKEMLVATPDDTSCRKRMPGETSVERAFRYLYAHYCEEVTLEEVAAYANQNATSLCRSFKSVCGSTIFQFINRLRIEKACSLLKNTDLNITQVAYQVGYNSLAHFNVQFKRFARMLPSDYKRS